MALDPEQLILEYDSGGVLASGVIRAGPLRLFMLFGFNNKASAQYIQVFDTRAVPADAYVPALPPLLVAATSAFYYDLGELGCRFLSGLSWSNSSTFATKTIASADCWVHAVYTTLPQ